MNKIKLGEFPYPLTKGAEESFECYRALGQHIAEDGLRQLFELSSSDSSLSFEDMAEGLSVRAELQEKLTEKAMLEKTAEKWDAWIAVSGLGAE